MISFNVDTAAAGPVTVVSVEGEIDVSTVAMFRRVLLAASPPTVIDLCGCEFIDSSGVHAILEHKLRDPCVQIACIPKGAPGRVLKLTLGDVVPVHATLEDAVAASERVAHRRPA
ncbi:MAG: anti-sigma factor antagonist [Solirubrobacterales bacterium]|nr:anti-sigma factor antagonist [Solirubrobacterales bacterium]